MQQTEGADRSAEQGRGGFSLHPPAASMAAHSGLRQLCPVLSAAVPGDDAEQRLSGFAVLCAVSAVERREQPRGCSALGLLFLCILPPERPVVAFRNSNYAPRDSAGGVLI